MKRQAKTAAKSAAQAEYPLVRLFDAHAQSPPVRALAWVSEVGDQPQLRYLSGVMIGAGLLGHRRLLRAGIRMLLAHELATVAKKAIKNRVDRTRPRSARSQRHAEPHTGRSAAKEESSFPSGHTAGAAAVAQALSREFPKYGVAARSAAALVGAAQVPRCAHYPSDVGVGALIGLSAEAAVNAAWKAVVKRPRA